MVKNNLNDHYWLERDKKMENMRNLAETAKRVLLGEGPDEMFIVIQGPGDNKQKVISIHKKKTDAIKARNKWNDKNGDRAKKDKKGKPIPAHLARIFQITDTMMKMGYSKKWKIGDKAMWSDFSKSLVKEEVELNEASIELPDHDGNDKNFKTLMMKLKLKYKTNVKKGDKDHGSPPVLDGTVVTGDAKVIQKMLQTMYGNDWKDMYKSKGNIFKSV